MKTHYIVSNFPLIAILTLGIYPLVVSLLLLKHLNDFNNREFVIACSMISLFGVFFFFMLPFIMGFFLDEKTPNQDYQQTTTIPAMQ